MRRYWIEKSQIEDGRVEFSGDLFRHIFVVCRQQVGQHFEVLSDDGKAYLLEVIEVGKKVASAKVIEQREVTPLKSPHIHLCVSLPRYQKMDEIVEKAVELGVHTLRPFVSDNSFVRKASSVPVGKQERWKKIIKSATQQCGRGELMTVAPICQLSELMEEFNRKPSTAGLFPYEGECEKTLQQELKALKSDGFEEIWPFVGSEGGFSSAEVQFFQDKGLSPVTLGSQVLRVETACLALVSIIKYELDVPS